MNLLRVRTNLCTTLILLFGFMLPINNVYADWVLRLGYDEGGEKLVRGLDEDGDSVTIKAGSAGYVEAGIAARLGTGQPDGTNISLPIDVELTIGFKSNVLENDLATGGDIRFERWTGTALAWYRFGKARIGTGSVFHYSPLIIFEGSNTSLQSSSTFGVTLLADYAVFDQVHAGVRVTKLEYRASNGTTSANTAGFFLGFRF